MNLHTRLEILNNSGAIYDESLIVVEDPKIINPKLFLEEVLNEWKFR
ncbi:MAG: hypothetical protein ACRC6K_00280 [Fusobacteriaceae bacterium]